MPVSRLRLSSLLILAIFCLIFTPLSGAKSEYKYFDKEGNEIVCPEVTAYFTLKKRGPWSPEIAKWHQPTLRHRYRKSGLENIRILDFSFSHPPAKKDEDMMEAIYVLDKDEGLIGYQKFISRLEPYQARMKLNGVINYITIYVFCKEHGIWKFETRLPLDRTEPVYIT